MLYLFTDGVSESMTSDAVLGVEEIYHLAKQDQGLNPTQRVAAIRQMFENGQLTTHDDATLMVTGKLSLTSHSDIKTSAKRPTEAVFLVKPASLPEARRFLEKVVADLGWSHRLMDIQVATGEILQNIIRYAVWKHRNQGRISIRVCRDSNDLNILVHDNAVPGQHEDWYKCAEAKRPSEGGLGLKLVSRLTDAVTFSHDAGNHVALKYNYHQKSQQ